jgi:hypothetical protein
MKTDDLLKAINNAITTNEMYEAVAAALQDAGIDNVSEPWGMIAARIEADRPELAHALRCADARWFQLLLEEQSNDG